MPRDTLKLPQCPTLDIDPQIFLSSEQNSDKPRLAMTRPKRGVGVRWGPSFWFSREILALGFGGI